MTSATTQSQEVSISEDQKKMKHLDENHNHETGDPEVLKTEQDGATPTPPTDTPPPSKLKCTWKARNTTLPFLIIFGFRTTYLLVVFFLWTINIIIRSLGIGRGFVPAKDSKVWKTLKENELSILAQFFFPHKPHPLIDISKSEYYYFFKGAAAGAYTFELLISSPYILYGIYVARKSLRYSRKYTNDWAGATFIPFIIYLWGAVNFLMSLDFGMFYYVDLIMIPMLVILIKIRMKWIDSLIKQGLTKVTKSNAVDVETPKLSEPTPEMDIKKDADFQNLFGENDKGDGHHDSLHSLEPDNSEATFTTESGVPSTIPSTSTDTTATTKSGRKTFRRDSTHVVEKVFTNTTIIAAATPMPVKAPKHTDKHHKNRSKHKKHNKKHRKHHR